MLITAPLLICTLFKLIVLPLFNEMLPVGPVNIIVDVLAVVVLAVLVRVFPTIIVALPKSVVTPELFRVRLLKVGVPEMVCVPTLPFNVTVLPVTT